MSSETTYWQLDGTDVGPAYTSATGLAADCYFIQLGDGVRPISQDTSQ